MEIGQYGISPFDTITQKTTTNSATATYLDLPDIDTGTNGTNGSVVYITGSFVRSDSSGSNTVDMSFVDSSNNALTQMHIYEHARSTSTGSNNGAATSVQIAQLANNASTSMNSQGCTTFVGMLDTSQELSSSPNLYVRKPVFWWHSFGNNATSYNSGRHGVAVCTSTTRIHRLKFHSSSGAKMFQIRCWPMTHEDYQTNV